MRNAAPCACFAGLEVDLRDDEQASHRHHQQHHKPAPRHPRHSLSLAFSLRVTNSTQRHAGYCARERSGVLNTELGAIWELGGGGRGRIVPALWP
eukprot:943861-Rhodomonas_salina.1